MTAEMPDVKLRALVNFPVSVTGRTAIDVVKTSGKYFIDLDVSRLVENPNISGDEVAASWMIVWNKPLNSYQVVPFSLAATAGVASIGGKTGALGIGDGLKFTGDTLELDFGVDSFATRTLAAAATIPAILTHIIVHGFNEIDDGGAGVFVEVGSNPGHPASFQSADGAYWELARTTGVIPNHVGRVGVNAATDTATIDAWLSCLDAGYSSGRWLGETYKVNGTRLKVLIGKRVIVDGGGSKLIQQQTFANTLYFQRAALVEVFGFEFTGYGAINPATEYHGDPGDVNPGSFKNVSAVSAFACDKVIIRDNISRYHVGFDFSTTNCKSTDISNNECQGVGRPTIKDGDLGTAAIGIDWDGDATYGLPTLSELAGIGRACGNRIYNHGFGVLAAFLNALDCEGNNIGPISGQHPFYLTGNNGVHVHNNECFEAGEIGIKIMLSREHLTFLNIPDWTAATNYFTGQDVKNGGNVYRAPSDFTSGATFGDDTLWLISPIQDHEGCHIHDNEIRDCQEGIHVVWGPTVEGYNMVQNGLSIHDNTIRRVEGYGIKTAYYRGDILNNQIDDAQFYGVYAIYGGGEIAGNKIYRSGRSGILAQPSFSLIVRDNLLEDCGYHASATGDDRIPLRVVDLTTPSNHPYHEASPDVDIRHNRQRWLTQAGPNGGVFSIETGSNIKASISYNRSNSTAIANVAGELVFAEGNTFSFNNSDMNDPTTFREGKPGREFRGRQNPAAAGSTAFHVKNEKCWNTNPSSGQPLYWICTVTGSPGTWAVAANMV